MFNIMSLVYVVLFFIAGFIIGVLLTFFLLDKSYNYTPKVKKTKQRNIEENNLSDSFSDEGFSLADEVYYDLPVSEKEDLINNNRKSQNDAYDYAINKEK